MVIPLGALPRPDGIPASASGQQVWLTAGLVRTGGRQGCVCGPRVSSALWGEESGAPSAAWTRKVRVERAQYHKYVLGLWICLHQLGKPRLSVFALVEPVLHNLTALLVEDHEHRPIVEDGYARLAVRPQADRRGRMAGFLFRLETVEGEPTEPPTLSAAVPTWKAGDTIPLERRTLRVVAKRDEDADQPPVLVVEEV